MEFKNWFIEQDLNELSDIRKMPTTDVHFEEVPEDEFDEDEAMSQCEREYDRSGDWHQHYDDLYDDVQDDPDFDTQSPDDWEDENPEPLPRDFEDDDEYEDAHSEWEDEKITQEKRYNQAVKEWELEQRNKRQEAEEAESDAKNDAIYNCVEEKKEEWKKEKAVSGGFVSKFNHDGQDFEVNINRIEMSYQQMDIPGAFSIEFTGPNDHSSTGAVGSNASAVYSKVLMAVKKLLETQTVNGLQFSPYEPGMGLIYQRFYDRFLKGTFIRTKQFECVRREFLQNALKDYPDYHKRKAYKGIIDAGRMGRHGIKQIQANRVQERMARNFLHMVLGRVVQTKNGENIYVIKSSFDTNGVNAVGIIDQGVFSPISLPIDKLTANPSSPEDTKRVLTAIAKNPNWLQFADNKALRLMFAKYGI